MTDKEISKKIQKRNMEAFDYIMSTYNKLLWLVIGNILEKVGSTEDVEDCISDVYLKLLQNPKCYDYKKGSLKSFLVRMGKNQAIDKYRKLTKGNVVELHEEIYSQEKDILDSLIENEDTSKLLSAITLLKEPDKEIMIRRYFFDEKPKDISVKMFLNIKEIENKLYQAKTKLKKYLEC